VVEGTWQAGSDAPCCLLAASPVRGSPEPGALWARDAARGLGSGVLMAIAQFQLRAAGVWRACACLQKGRGDVLISSFCPELLVRVLEKKNS